MKPRLGLDMFKSNILKSSNFMQQVSKALLVLSAVVLSAAALVVINPAILMAEAAGHGAGHAPHISHLTWYAINFVIYVGLLYWLLHKPYVSFWARRRAEIVEQVGRGERLLQEAQHKLRLARERLAQLDSSALTEITKKIEHEGAVEAEQIIKSAKDDELRLRQQLEQNILAERLTAETRVRKELAELVLNKAQEKVKANYSADKDVSRRASAINGAGGLLQ